MANNVVVGGTPPSTSKQQQQTRTMIGPTNPPTGFDWLSYINQYPDLQKAGINSGDLAYQHWNNYGQYEGRTPPAQTVADQPLGMIASGNTFTNRAGTGLDANGALLPGWRYANYVDGKGVGTPINVAAAVNAYPDGGLGAQLANLGHQDYAQYSSNPGTRNQMQQVMSRTSPGSSVGPQPVTQGISRAYGLPNISSVFSTGVPGSTGYRQYPTTSNNLWSMFPRRRAVQSFNRGSQYFSPITGNYIHPW